MVGLRVRGGGVNTDRMVFRSATMTNRTKATRWIMCMNGRGGRTRGTGASLLAVAPKTMTDGSASMIDFSGFVEAHVTGITFTEDDKGVSIFFADKPGSASLWLRKG
jgi:hypothetical protein